MKLDDVLKNNKTQLEIAKVIVENNVKVAKSDIFDLIGGQTANPSKDLCRLLLRHGNEMQQKRTVAFIVGSIIESRVYRNMREDVNAYAELLFEYFEEEEAKALDAAEKAVAAAATGRKAK
jgi:hypothetical protein